MPNDLPGVTADLTAPTEGTQIEAPLEPSQPSVGESEAESKPLGSEPTASESKPAKAKLAKGRALVDSDYGKANTIIEVAPGIAKQLAKEGIADFESAAVEYALSQKA